MWLSRSTCETCYYWAHKAATNDNELKKQNKNNPQGNRDFSLVYFTFRFRADRSLPTQLIKKKKKSFM